MGFRRWTVEREVVGGDYWEWWWLCYDGAPAAKVSDQGMALALCDHLNKTRCVVREGILDAQD
jgi:hypothetical protein